MAVVTSLVQRRIQPSPIIIGGIDWVGYIDQNGRATALTLCSWISGGVMLAAGESDPTVFEDGDQANIPDSSSGADCWRLAADQELAALRRHYGNQSLYPGSRRGQELLFGPSVWGISKPLALFLRCLWLDECRPADLALSCLEWIGFSWDLRGRFSGYSSVEDA